MALVRFPDAFRLRKLAQNGCPVLGALYFSCNFPHDMAFVQARTKRAPLLGRGIFSVNSRIKWLLSDVYVHFDCSGPGTFSLYIVAQAGSCGDAAKFLSARSLHDPVKVLNRRSYGDPSGVL